MLIGYLGQAGSIIWHSKPNRFSEITGVETRLKPIPRKHSWNLNNYGRMQNKRNVCTDQRIIGKAFFKMFLLIPTQSEQPFRVLLIKTINEISLWQQTIWLADKLKEFDDVGIKTKAYRISNKKLIAWNFHESLIRCWKLTLLSF